MQNFFSNLPLLSFRKCLTMICMAFAISQSLAITCNIRPFQLTSSYRSTAFINFIAHFLMQRFTVTGVLGAHGVTVAAEELTSYVNATIHPPKMEENRAKGLDVRLKSVLLVRFPSVCRSVFRLQK